jgi:hypothetical protein
VIIYYLEVIIPKYLLKNVIYKLTRAVTTKNEAKKLKKKHKQTEESLEAMESRPRVAEWENDQQLSVRDRLPYKTPDGRTIQRSTISNGSSFSVQILIDPQKRSRAASVRCFPKYWY